MDLILQSHTLSAEFVQDRLQRQAAYMTGQCVVGQLELLMNKEFAMWAPPDAICVRRLRPPERRVKLPNSNEHVIINDDDSEVPQKVRYQLPVSALSWKFHIQTHVCDRHTVNSSLLFGLSHLGYMVCFFFGWYHALWNGIKNSLKRASRGRGWQTVYGFLVVQNLNFYPFKSGEFFRKKARCLSRLPGSSHIHVRRIPSSEILVCFTSGFALHQ